MTAAATLAQAPAPERVAFYVSAHEDDWQLFMNPPAFRDALDETCRCVFIHMTAGDAGLGTGDGGRTHPYFLAREHGAEAAIRFMADANDRVPAEPAVTAPRFAGHPIRRVGYRNTVAYFLRLPDGNPEGGGYEATGHQSLKHLAEGAVDTCAAIDGSTAYRGWNDLTATLRQLIDAERAKNLAVDMHVPETDAARNLNDHADHVFSAKAVRAAAEDLPARWHHHVGYASGALAENLAPEDRDMKCAVYAVTMAGVLAQGHPISWQHYDRLFVGRDYCRIEERR
jgi:hypothetical protein